MEKKGTRQRDRERGKVALSSQPKAHFAKATDSRKPRNPAPHPHVQSLRSQRAHGIGTYHIAPHYIFLARRAQPALIVTGLRSRRLSSPVRFAFLSKNYTRLHCTGCICSQQRLHINRPLSTSIMSACQPWLGAWQCDPYRFVSA